MITMLLELVGFLTAVIVAAVVTAMLIGFVRWMDSGWGD